MIQDHIKQLNTSKEESVIKKEQVEDFSVLLAPVDDMGYFIIKEAQVSTVAAKIMNKSFPCGACNKPLIIKPGETGWLNVKPAS